MKLSSKAENILAQITSKTKLGDLRTIAKSTKKDHELLWNYGQAEAYCRGCWPS